MSKKIMINRVGEKFITNQGYEVEIIEYNSAHDVVVKFNCGYTKKCEYSQIKRGRMLYPFHKSIFGIGYVGVGNYDTVLHKVAYKKWKSMIARCYSSSKKYYGYENCIVCEDWHNFQNFAEWFYRNDYVENFELDKDLFSSNDELIYSPETCVLIPSWLNCFIRGYFYNQSHNTSGKTGVVLYSRTNKYKAQIKDFTTKNTIHLGYFNTINEAYESYIKKKKEFFDMGIQRAISENLNNKIISKLIELKNGI